MNNPSQRSSEQPTTDALQATHDAAWERYNAAELAIKHDHSPSMQREYAAAAKQLQTVQLQIVRKLGGFRLGGAS